MKECAGAVGTLTDKRSEVPRMDETLKLRWLYCPRCGGKTRTQIRSHTVLEDLLCASSVGNKHSYLRDKLYVK